MKVTLVYQCFSLLFCVQLTSAFFVPPATPTQSSVSLFSATIAPESTETSESTQQRQQQQQQRAIKLAALKPALAKDVNVVAAGGWYNLQQHVDDPKKELVQWIVQRLQSTDKVEEEATNNDELLAALVTLLYAQGKGFSSDVVDGEWSLVFSKQGSKSPRFQKVVSRREKVGGSKTTSNFFHVNRMTFTGDSTILKKGILSSTVKYSPMTEGYSKTTDGKIVLRRIGCDIVGASWKFWFLPKLPLPLRVKGGYLEFVYMDGDIRITKGNRGGLFIHFRPEFLEQQLSAASQA